MIEVNFSISETVIGYAIMAACVFAYSIAGAIAMGIADGKRKCVADDWPPPGPIVAVFWPAFLFGLATYGIFIVLWWTMLLPARFIYRMTVKGMKS